MNFRTEERSNNYGKRVMIGRHLNIQLDDQEFLKLVASKESLQDFLKKKMTWAEFLIALGEMTKEMRK